MRDKEYILDCVAMARPGHNYWLAVHPKGMVGTISGEGETLAEVLANDCRCAVLYAAFPPSVEELTAARQAGVLEIKYALPVTRACKSNGLPDVRRNWRAGKEALKHYGYKWQD